MSALVTAQAWHHINGADRRRGRSVLTDRDSLIAGTYKPDLTTTGVPAGNQLTATYPSGGDIIITTPNTVLEDLDIYGWVTVRAANVIIRRCRVRGGPALPAGQSGRGLIQSTHSLATNLLIEDCILVPDTPDHKTDGVYGKSYTAKRCYISQTTDGFGATNLTSSGQADVTLLANYVQDLHYIAWPGGVGQPPEVPHSDHQTHNDGIQAQGGGNITVIGNRFESGTDNLSGIMITPNVSATPNITIHHNWFNKVREFYININEKTFGPLQNLVITDNICGRQHGYQWVFNMPASTGSVSTISGNVYEDDASPVPIRQHFENV